LLCGYLGIDKRKFSSIRAFGQETPKLLFAVVAAACQNFVCVVKTFVFHQPSSLL
jgi:hypothetical protein